MCSTAVELVMYSNIVPYMAFPPPTPLSLKEAKLVPSVNNMVIYLILIYVTLPYTGFSYRIFFWLGRERGAFHSSVN